MAENSTSSKTKASRLTAVREYAQLLASTAALGVPVAVAAMVVAATGRDLNTAVAVIRVSDPVRLGFTALLALALVTVLLPMILDFFAVPPTRPHHWIQWIVFAGILGLVWFAAWLSASAPAATFITCALVAAYAIRWLAHKGTWRTRGNWGAWLAVTASLFAFSAINPYPQAAITFDEGSPPQTVRIVAMEGSGIWYLTTSAGGIGPVLRWYPNDPAEITVCTWRSDPCDDLTSPEPSSGSPSSTPSPSAG